MYSHSQTYCHLPTATPRRTATFLRPLPDVLPHSYVHSQTYCHLLTSTPRRTATFLQPLPDVLPPTYVHSQTYCHLPTSNRSYHQTFRKKISVRATIKMTLTFISKNVFNRYLINLCLVRLRNSLLLSKGKFNYLNPVDMQEGVHSASFRIVVLQPGVQKVSCTAIPNLYLL